MRSFKSQPKRSSTDALTDNTFGDVSEWAIAAHDITMIYTSRAGQYCALNSVDLNISPGTVQLLMGPSGSGKTTLLSILGGILTPTSGHVYLLGTDITQLTAKQRAAFRLRHIGFIFQGFNLFPALTAAENVEIVMQLSGIPLSEARARALSLLATVGLEAKADDLPENLSGGQKQRVAIARALANHPSIILADEPTAALDSQSGRAVISQLCTLARDKGRTVLMVTHDPRIVDVADHVLHLEDGHIQ